MTLALSAKDVGAQHRGCADSSPGEGTLMSRVAARVTTSMSPKVFWVLAWFHSSAPAMWPQHRPVPAPGPQSAHQGARAPRWASQQQAVTSATGLPHVLVMTCRWFMCSQCKLQSQCNCMGINLWTPIPCPLPQIVSLFFFFVFFHPLSPSPGSLLGELALSSLCFSCRGNKQ